MTPPARHRDLIAAEWLKLWSLRSTPWSLAIAALTVVAFNALAAHDQYRAWPRYEAADRARFIASGMALQSTFTGNAAMILMLAVGAIGAVTVVGEYSTGAIRTTFAAVPARGSVLAAKATVVTAVTTALGVLVSAASFALARTIMSGRDIPLPLDDPATQRLLVSSALLAPLSALIGMATAVLIRHGPTTMLTVFTVALLLPLVLSDDHHWSAVLDHLTPYMAWSRLSQPDAEMVPYPWTVGGAWTVFAGWAVASALLTVTVVRYRDQ
ncbi:ABC transporter permease [Streptomyces litchfieldiae]|uniref:ABC transporter permease n=1 Tax=Streptomyces litchfieldiae TaxID=3075543 RepID=A0ABU2MM43_9ACTN|nr:ABC transporter permease [Streptomyces sp. DSM 44938]MDT0342677.1 ABC transporter permease [Streptomyces sp. DSM 44938]